MGRLLSMLSSYWRAPLCLTLLLGPLYVAEEVIFHSPRELIGVMRDWEAASDVKRMLIVERGCPELVAFGTSVTDRTIIGTNMDGKRMQAGFRLEYSFDFASGQVRAEIMLSQWRWLQRRDCTPPFVVVELSPLVLNHAGRSDVHDAAMLSLPTLLAMPDGFLATREYTPAMLAQRLTFDRLMTFRRRKQLMRWVAQEVGLREVPKARPYPADGQIRGVPNRRMTPKLLKKETHKRKRHLWKRRYRHAIGALQMSAMDQLADEIERSDSRLIFHTTPTLPLYRKLFEKLGGKREWCEVVARYRKRPGIEWFNQFSTTEYPNKRFHDWVHLNKRGARTYANNFRKAVFHRKYPHDSYCD